jgi:hypothetical protein
MVESVEVDEKIRLESGGALLATERASEELASKLPASVLMASSPQS